MKKFMKNHMRESFKTAWVLFKILIPVSIIIKIIELVGGIEWFGRLFSPLMEMCGLPGPTGIVWATAIATNLYGGMVAFFTITDHTVLTVSQATILTTMMLIAHGFPVELQIARKAGVKMVYMFLFRFLGAIAMGLILNWVYGTFSFLEGVNSIHWLPRSENAGLVSWGVEQLKRYFMILLIIFALLLLVKILDYLKVMDFLKKLLRPVLGPIGLDEEAIPVNLIGLTMGISYGGAFIVRAAQSGEINRKNILYSLVLMGFCHSVIEDSLLMMSLGGHYSGIFVGRILFTFAAVFILSRLDLLFSYRISNNMTFPVYIKK